MKIPPILLLISLFIFSISLSSCNGNLAYSKIKKPERPEKLEKTGKTEKIEVAYWSRVTYYHAYEDKWGAKVAANPKMRNKVGVGVAAANNIVFGIGGGSFLYGMTRDTLGWACKATACIINGEFKEIYKDPITDSGLKKSAKGLLRVDKVNGEYVLKDQCSKEEEDGGELKPVFKDGKLLKDWSLSEIRANLQQYL